MLRSAVSLYVSVCSSCSGLLFMVASSAKKRFGSSALRNSYGQSRRDCCCASVAFLRPHILTMFKVVCSAVLVPSLEISRKHNENSHAWVRSDHKHCKNVIFSCGALLSVCHRCGFCLPRPNALALCRPSHRTLLSQDSPQNFKLFSRVFYKLFYVFTFQNTNNCLVPTRIHERMAALQYIRLRPLQYISLWPMFKFKCF